MMNPTSLFGLSEHLERLSEHGDPLVVLDETVDFEYFRAWLVEGLDYSDGRKGGRPPFDPVAMFKALILQAQHNLSDAKMEFMICDRLSWMRSCGLSTRLPYSQGSWRVFRQIVFVVEGACDVYPQRAAEIIYSSVSLTAAARC